MVSLAGSGRKPGFTQMRRSGGVHVGDGARCSERIFGGTRMITDIVEPRNRERTDM